MFKVECDEDFTKGLNKIKSSCRAAHRIYKISKKYSIFNFYVQNKCARKMEQLNKESWTILKECQKWSQKPLNV